MKLESTVWCSSNIPGKRLTQIVNRVFNRSVKKDKMRRKQISWPNCKEIRPGGQQANWICSDICCEKYPSTLWTLPLGVRTMFPFRELRNPLQGDEVSSLSHCQAGWAPEQTAELTVGRACRAHQRRAEGERAESRGGSLKRSLALPRAARKFITSFTRVVLVFGVRVFGSGTGSGFQLSLWEEGASPRGLGELWSFGNVTR